MNIRVIVSHLDLSDYFPGHNIMSNLGSKMSCQEANQFIRSSPADIVIAGTERYDATLLDACVDLKMIMRFGSGIDSIDLEACKARGIAVSRTLPPANSVAELTISHMLMFLRKTHTNHANMKNGQWTRLMGRELSEITVGVIGYGNIGTAVVNKLRSLGTGRVLVDDLNPSLSETDKHTLLKESDVITLHAGANALDKQSLSLLKKDVILINTSRGNAIDEDALYEWLKENSAAYAALDVFTEEPYSGRLRELDNVILTPHVGSFTSKSRAVMKQTVIEEVNRFLAGKSRLYKVI